MINFIIIFLGLLAQMVEQLTFNQLVTGSIPVQPILYFKIDLKLLINKINV